MVKKHILHTSNKDLLIFIPYFLPDHSYGGPIVSVNALINTIKFRKRIFLYSTSLFFSSQKKFRKDEKANNFLYKIIRNDSHFKNFINTIIVLLKSKQKTIYINSFFYTPNSIPFFLLSYFLISKKNRLIISTRAELQESKIKLKKSILKKILIIIFKKLSSPKIIFLSSSEEEMIFNKKHFKENIHITIPNLPKFKKFIVKENLKDRAKKVIFFSRVSKEKRLDIFLNSLIKENKKLPIELTILGSHNDENYLKKINKLCKELKIRGYKIKVLGYRNITQKFLSNFEIMLLPSIGENYSHTTVEASQSGLFCLISNQTPWFKKTQSAKQGMTCIPIDQSSGYIESIKKITELSPSEFNKLINEQQKEVKRIIKSSAKKMEDLFIN